MINQNFFQSITENAIKYCPELQSWPDQYLLRAQELKLLLKDFHLTTKVPTLLEIGCGTGFISALLSRISEICIATDIPDKNIYSHTPGLNTAALLLKKLNIKNVHLVGLKNENLPFPNNTFDIIYSAYTLEHVDSRISSVSEIYRVLKPDGLFICAVPSLMERFLYPTVYYPQILITAFQYFLIYFKKMIRLQSKLKKPVPPTTNPAVPQKKKLSWKNLKKSHPHFPFPYPHGSFPTYFHEVFYYSPFYWKKLLQKGGFIIFKTKSTMCCLRHPLSYIYCPLKFYLKFEKFETLIGKNRLFKYFGQNFCMFAKKT